jgi:hypothetical protein
MGGSNACTQLEGLEIGSWVQASHDLFSKH